MQYLVFSCSLNSASRSHRLALQAAEQLNALRAGEAECVDLRTWNLPFCDGKTCQAAPQVGALCERIAQAEGILIASPVYNYDVNAAAKNLVELTGRHWADKVVGFLCSAGGKGSYMAPMGLANSLMLDFHCLILPRFVYAEESAIVEGAIRDDEILRRIDELCRELVGMAEARRALRFHA